MLQIDRLKIRTEESNDNLLNDLLESAKSIIFSIRFPYSEWPDAVERRYIDLQIRIAEDLYNRFGASGQLSHSENSISRSWGSECVSEQLLREITPLVGSVK